MAELLSANLDLIAARIRAASDLFVFTDFDGTLVPINDSPSEIFPGLEIKRALSLLVQEPHVTLGVVSGRELGDLKARIGIDHIIYAGNHGLEIEGAGFTFREPTAIAMIPVLQTLVTNLARELSGIQGTLIEDKKLSVSIHYRKVESHAVPPLIDIASRVAAPALNANKVVLRNSKMVLEIRPAVDWHKGSAVKWLVKKLAKGSEPLIIYIGDDETDEDAFATLLNQITICVGLDRKTVANFSVVDHRDVLGFIAWLLGVVVVEK